MGVYVCVFARAHNVLWKDLRSASPQKLMWEFRTNPQLRTWVPQPQQHTDGQFCAGTFQRSPLSSC